MTIAKHAQWADMQRKADLPETDPDHLSREVLQSLFFGKSWPIVKWLGERLNESRDQVLSDLEDYRAGRFIRCEEPMATPIIKAPTIIVPPIEPIARTASTSHLVEAMLRAGVYKHAQRPNSRLRGMSEQEYGALWPSEVTYPAGYADRFPHLLLVDQTLKPDELKGCCIDTDFWIDPVACKVQRGVPKFLVGPDSKRLNRAVMFWGYEQRLGLSVTDCRKLSTADNIPMIHWHGHWIIIQHRDGILCRHAIDLLGSGFGALLAPYVHRFDRARPYFYAVHVENPLPRWGSGFRGSEVVIVP